MLASQITEIVLHVQLCMAIYLLLICFKTAKLFCAKE